MNNTTDTPSPAKAWIITGPTSGIGRRTAQELAEHGTVVLVGRDPSKLARWASSGIGEAFAGTPLPV